MAEIKNQSSLFSDDKPDNSRLHEQLIKLGDMMGDGLHHESDGKWIPKEYAKVLNALYPDIKKDARKAKAASIDIKIAEKLKTDRCLKCNGVLLQVRKGSKTVQCISPTCRAKFEYSSKKSK